MQCRVTALATGAFLLLSASPSSAEVGRELTPVTDQMLSNPDGADWLMWRRTLDAQGYSPLNEIDAGNVARLELAWSRELAPGPSQEGTPLVYDGVMFFPHPLDITEALDAATGEPLWRHQRSLPDDVGRFIPFPATNRNLAIYDLLVIDNGSDDYVYALDAKTGELAWETKIFDYRINPAKQGSGPIVAAGKVISGRNCMPAAGPSACVITAHDARTGAELWRTRTIPQPDEPGGDSWGEIDDENRWHVGSWLVPSFDAELNLVYVGTSVVSPAPKFMLAGNNLPYLYHNSTLALDADTGAIVWYYQHLVDHWDLDHAFERILVDTVVAPDPDEVEWINPRLQPGEQRKILTGIPGKTGIIYTLDRQTGELLWARQTLAQNVVEYIDGATGAVTVNPEVLFTAAGQQLFVCPSAQGGKNWPPGTYDPQRSAMYFPMYNTCMTAESIAEEPSLDSVYALNLGTAIAPGTGNVGTVQAYSVQTGKLLWKHEQRAGVMALVATGGDLIFAGDTGGRFFALHAETGELLWETQLGSEVSGPPVTYAAGGKQYVAVSTGTSNLTGALSRLTPELRPERENRLFVFALPE